MRIASALLSTMPWTLRALSWPVGSFSRKANIMGLGGLVYVGRAGNDTTGDGSFDNPFASIGKAMASITTATPATPFTIVLGPGTYTEDVALKPSVSIVGIDPIYTSEINGNVSLDASWASVSDEENSGISNALVQGGSTVNFGTQEQGSVLFVNVTFVGAVSLLGANGDNSNTVAMVSCFLFDPCTVEGIDLSSSATDFTGGVTFAATGSSNAFWTSESDAISGGMSVTSSGSHTAIVDSVASAVEGTLTLDGAESLYTCSAPGIPTTVTLQNGAPPPVLTTLSEGIDYTPTTPGNWAGSPPTTVQQALDRIAANVGNAHPIP